MEYIGNPEFKSNRERKAQIKITAGSYKGNTSHLRLEEVSYRRWKIKVT